MKGIKVLVLSFSMLFASVCMGQNFSGENSGSFSITANPIFFGLGGYSIKGFYHLPKRWSFGLAAEANFELPELARDQFFENDGDIIVDWDYLVGIEARYRFTDSAIDKGFYAFGTLGYEGWTISDGAAASDGFENWYASLGIGFNWYPFKKPNFHIGASYGVVFILNNTANREIGALEYNIRPVVLPSFVPTVYLGWRL